MAMFFCPGNHWTSCSTNGSICVSSWRQAAILWNKVRSQTAKWLVEGTALWRALCAFDSCIVCGRGGGWVGGPGIFNKNVRGAHRKGGGWEQERERESARGGGAREKNDTYNAAAGENDPRIRTRISAILLVVESDAASAAATVEPGSGRAVDFLRNLFMVALALTGTSERRKGEKEKRRKGKEKWIYILCTGKNVNSVTGTDRVHAHNYTNTTTGVRQLILTLIR